MLVPTEKYGSEVDGQRGFRELTGSVKPYIHPGSEAANATLKSIAVANEIMESVRPMWREQNSALVGATARSTRLRPKVTSQTNTLTTVEETTSDSERSIQYLEGYSRHSLYQNNKLAAPRPIRHVADRTYITARRQDTNCKTLLILITPSGGVR
jgi:hypothetical protein